MSNFSRVGRLLDDFNKRKQIGQGAVPQRDFSDFDTTQPTSQRVQQVTAPTAREARTIPTATKWLSKQPDLGVRLGDEGKPVVETTQSVSQTAEGRRLGSLENIRKALKATSVGATQAQKKAGHQISKKVRQELVEEHADVNNWNKVIKKRVASEAAKNTPGSEGATLAAKLMRVREENNLNDIALNKDYPATRKTYKQALQDVINRKHGNELDTPTRDRLIENLDTLTDTGLEALSRNYARGIKGMSNYQAPSRTTAILSSGQHVADKFYRALDIDPYSQVDPDEKQVIDATFGAIIEEASDRAGFTTEIREEIPRGKRPASFITEKIERVPASAEFQELLETIPNVKGDAIMPSFTKPHKWTSKNARDLVKSHDKQVQKEIADNEAVLDVTNDIQSVPYTINTKTLDNVVALQKAGKLTTPEPTPEMIAEWQQLNKQINSLQFRLDNLPPKKYRSPKQQEFAESLEGQIADIGVIFDPLNRQISKQTDESITIQRAQAFANNNMPFYYRVQFGDNFRMYYTTPLVNPQGSPLGRGVLQFAEGEKLSSSGVQILKTEAASYLEYPNGQKIKQLPVADRIKHFDEIEADMTRWGEDPVGTFDEWSPLVDEKNQIAFLNAIQDYHGWKTDPYHKSHRVTAMDATTSGIQIIAALLDDETIGGIVNLINDKVPGDLYLHTAGKVKDIVRQNADAGDPIAANIINNDKLWANERTMFKRPTMVVPYGSGARNIGETMIEDLAAKGVHLDKQAADYLGKIMDDEMTNIVPALGVFKEIVQKMTSQMFTPIKVQRQDGTEIDQFVARKPTFRTDTGFPYRHDYPDFEFKDLKVQFKGERATLTPQVRKDYVGGERKSKAETALMAKLVHFLDANLLHKTAAELKKRGIKNKAFVHDQFAVGPNDVDEMLEVIREVMKDMFGGKKGEGPRILEQLIEGATDEAGNPIFNVDDFREIIRRGDLDIEETISDARPFDFG